MSRDDCTIFVFFGLRLMSARFWLEAIKRGDVSIYFRYVNAIQGPAVLREATSNSSIIKERTSIALFDELAEAIVYFLRLF